MTVDTKSGYGCGCLVLLGLIGFLGLSTLVANRLSGAVGAKQSEAKQYVGSMNRAQEAYFLEEGNFTDNIPELGLGIRTETENYTYSTYATPLSVINYGVSRKSDLKSYVSGVFLGSVEETGEMTTFAIFCQVKSPGTHRLPAPIVKEGMLQCAPGTESLGGEDEKRIFIGEDWKLVDVSANYASAGEYNQALDSAKTITDDLIKAKALEGIATELATAGKSKQALPILEKIQAIALQLTDAGEYEQAVQVAKTITDYEQKAKALDAIVRRLAATGNDKRAVELAETISSYYGGKEKLMAAIERYQHSQ